jgi:hypothetical protein
MYDPEGPWRHFERDEEFQRAAMGHMMENDPMMKRSVNKHHRSKYGHPNGGEAWHVGREENWGMGQVELHRKAVSSLKETIKRPDLALLAALRADLVHQTGGVSTNIELESVDPVKALELAKTLMKHKGSVTRFQIDMADDSTRLEGFLEFVAQLHTSREGQAWVRTQLDRGKQSKSGKHVIAASQLNRIMNFYKVQEELALTNIRSLKETQPPTIGYDRIDRFFRNIALDIFRVQRAYADTIEGLAAYPGYRRMLDMVKEASATEDEAGVTTAGITTRMNQLASLIIATNDLHMTERGNRYIKERMFDVLAHFRLLILHLEYKGEADYQSLQYFDLTRSQGLLADVSSRSASYRRTVVYEVNILYAGGFATPIELLKSAGRALKASTRTLARGVRNIRGRQDRVNAVWEATTLLMKRACQPLFGALSNIAQDWLEDSPHSEALSMNLEIDVEPAQIEEAVEVLRGKIVQQWPEQERAANRVARCVQAELQECADLRRGIDQEVESAGNYEQVNDDEGGEGSLTSIMGHFEMTVQQKLRNRKAMLASVREELHVQTALMREIVDGEPVLGFAIDQPISEEVAVSVEDDSQGGTSEVLAMSPNNLNDAAEVKENSEAVLAVAIDEIEVQLSQAEPSAPPNGLVNYNSNGY